MNEPQFSVFSATFRSDVSGKIHRVLGDRDTLCGRRRSSFEVTHSPDLEVTCMQCLKVIETMIQEGRLAPPHRNRT